jgi:hypothetical protein
MPGRTLLITSLEQLQCKETFGLDIDLDDVVLLSDMRHSLIVAEIVQLGGTTSWASPHVRGSGRGSLGTLTEIRDSQRRSLRPELGLR